MTDQPFLWPPHNATQTSREAAASIVPIGGRLRRQVYEAIKASPDGMTCQEVEEALGLGSGTATARINELAQRERVIESDGTRPTRSGRRANVWRARL